MDHSLLLLGKPDQHQGLLGPHADVTGAPRRSHFTTTYRQDLIFREMQKIVTHYLELWLT